MANSEEVKPYLQYSCPCHRWWWASNVWRVERCTDECV